MVRVEVTRISWGSILFAALLLFLSSVPTSAEVCDKVAENWVPGEDPLLAWLQGPFLYVATFAMFVLLAFNHFGLTRTSKAIAIALAVFAVILMFIDDNEMRKFAYIEGCRSFAHDVVQLFF